MISDYHPDDQPGIRRALRRIEACDPEILDGVSLLPGVRIRSGLTFLLQLAADLERGPSAAAEAAAAHYSAISDHLPSV